MITTSGERYSVIDFETTGFSPENGDRCIEVGLVLLQDGVVIDRYQSLTKTGVSVSKRITQLTGIENADLVNAPSCEKVIEDVLRLSKGSTLVAHNAAFDRRFWRNEVLLATGQEDNQEFLCTLMLSRRLIPGLDSYKLDCLGVDYGYKDNERHRALHDSEVTAEILVDLVSRAKIQFPDEEVDFNFLNKIQKTPLKKILNGNIGKAARKENVASVIDVRKPDPKPVEKSIVTEDGHSELRAVDISKRIDDENVVVLQVDTKRYGNGNVSSYKATVSHELLNRKRTFSSKHLEILQSKIQQQILTWSKQCNNIDSTQSSRSDGIEVQSSSTNTVTTSELSQILSHTLGVDDAVDWSTLRVAIPFGFERAHDQLIQYGENDEPLEPIFQSFDEEPPTRPQSSRMPRREDFVSVPTFWESVTLQKNRILSADEQRYEKASRRWHSEEDRLQNQYESDLERWSKNKEKATKNNSYIKVIFEHEKTKWEDAVKQYEAENSLLNSDINSLELRYESRDTDAVEEYCHLVLERSVYPEFWQREVMVDYQADKKVLVLNFKLPELDELPKARERKGNEISTKKENSYYSEEERASIYQSVVTQIMIRTVHEIFEADVVNAINDVCVNGYITREDDSEKHISNEYIASLFAEKTSFLKIDLSQTDSIACYESLGGRGKFDGDSVWTIDPIVGSEFGPRKRSHLLAEGTTEKAVEQILDGEPESGSTKGNPIADGVDKKIDSSVSGFRNSGDDHVLPHPGSLLNDVSFKERFDKLLLQLRNNAGSAKIDIGQKLSDVLSLSEEQVRKIPNFGAKKTEEWKKLVELYNSSVRNEVSRPPESSHVDRINPGDLENNNATDVNTGFRTTQTTRTENIHDRLDIHQLRLIQAGLTSSEISALRRLSSRGLATGIEDILAFTATGLKQIDGIGAKVSGVLMQIRDKCELECSRIADGVISIEKRESYLIGLESNRFIHLAKLDKILTDDIVQFGSREDIDKEVFKRRWGIGARRKTLEEIGNSRNQTHERIRQVESDNNERLVGSLRVLSTEICDSVGEEKRSNLVSRMPKLSDLFDTEENFIKFIQFISGDKPTSTVTEASEALSLLESTIYPEQLQLLLDTGIEAPVVGEEVTFDGAVIAMLEWQWNESKVGLADGIGDKEVGKLVKLGWRLVYGVGGSDVGQLKEWLALEKEVELD